MIKNQNIICISSIDWDFVWQGHQEIMSTFAKHGNTVLFIENTGVRRPIIKDFSRLKKRFFSWLNTVKGFRKEQENLYIYSPVILPFPYSRLARLINQFLFIRPLKKWMKATNFHDPIIWTFLPTGVVLDIINNIDNKLLVYYCIADFYKLTNPKKVKITEDKLIKASDLVFVQGKYLAEKCKRLNPNIHIFPFGVRIEAFNNFKSSDSKIPVDIAKIKRPIIGYVGGIHRHIDFKLIMHISKKLSDCSIVLIGPVQANIGQISNLSNVYLLGKKEFTDLPNYINQFNVGIIPYELNDYTETVFPTKLNEYLALGKPVVSTVLPEVISFNAANGNPISIGNSYDDFTDLILDELANNNEKLAENRIKVAEKNNWSERIEKMSNLIESELYNLSKKKIDWKEKFLKTYKDGKNKFIKISISFLLFYLIVFYTPLVWFLAIPLKIAQPPEQADSIVVLAGGVGESGKAGQGYEERVEYAAKLYKKGFGQYLIFSSGYSYYFKEPLVMKALAVSLGVPENRIILEEKAKNTYENVLFTKAIIDKNKWNKILLVSSPYHMRRLSLVVLKNAPRLTFVFTPVPDAIFYKHGAEGRRKLIYRQLSIQQLKAIVHEFTAIIYYMFKGWI